MVVYRRESRRRPILVMVVITSLALITLDTGGSGVIASIRSSARDVIAPVQDVVDDAFHPVRELVRRRLEVRRGAGGERRLRGRINELERKPQPRNAPSARTSPSSSKLLDLPNIEDVTGVSRR